jgi:sorting nexin-4
MPPLPSKQRLDYLDRFSDEFIEKRRISLDRFLKRVSAHSMLGKTKALKLFLCESNFNAHVLESIAEQAVNATTEGLMDSVSEAFMKAFTKVKKPSEQFVKLSKVSVACLGN